MAEASMTLSASNACTRRTSMTNGDEALPSAAWIEEIETGFAIAVSMKAP